MKMSFLKQVLEAAYAAATIAVLCSFLTFNLWKDNWVILIAVIYFLSLKCFYCLGNWIQLAGKNDN